MEELDDIVINLRDLTTTITRKGFGLPLIYSIVSDIDYQEFGSLSGITEATPAIDADVVLLATAVFRQEPLIEKIAVYGKDNTVDAGKGTAVSATGTTLVLRADTGKADDVFNANVVYIYAGTGAGQWRTITDYVGSTNTATVNSTWKINPDSTSKYAIFNIATLETAIKDDFTALALQGKMGWYWLLTNARTSTVASTPAYKAISSVVTTYMKIGILLFAGATAKTDAETFSKTSNLGGNNSRITVVSSDKDDALLDCATVGRMATYTPGSATMKFKQLTGQDSTGYTDSEVASLHSNFVNTYVTKFGVAQLSEGLTTSSKKEYLDIIVLKDYITARISENLGQLFLNTDKISFDGDGIRTIGANVSNTFIKFVTEKLIAKDDSGTPVYSISVPKFNSLDVVDKGNRKLKDITFNATLAGAIHKVDITGYLVL